MMRSAIAFLLCIAAVAQLSCLTVEAFSLIPATSVAKKVQVTKNKKKPVAKKAAAKAKPKVKAAAKAKPKAKAKAKPKPKAKAAPKKKIVVKKVVVKKAPKRKIQTTTSATAANVANSGTDAALAITKNFKPKKANNSGPLFPGLQSSSSKKSAPKKTNGAAAKAKGATVIDNGAVNPISFGLRVAQSEKGKEATSVLIDGGLKLVTAILEEGKKTKVVIPQGFDTESGDLKKAKVTNVGLPQLLDAGIFAGTEFLGKAQSNYQKFYVGKK